MKTLTFGKKQRTKIIPEHRAAFHPSAIFCTNKLLNDMTAFEPSPPEFWKHVWKFGLVTLKKKKVACLNLWKSGTICPVTIYLGINHEVHTQPTHDTLLWHRVTNKAWTPVQAIEGVSGLGTRKATEMVVGGRPHWLSAEGKLLPPPLE